MGVSAHEADVLRGRLWEVTALQSQIAESPEGLEKVIVPTALADS